MSFTTIASGAQIKASDVNQYVDAFNGAVVANLTLTPGSNAQALSLLLPAGVASGSSWLTGALTTDTQPLISVYYTSAGTTGLAFGPGGSTAPTHLLEANSGGGWTILQPFSVSGALNVSAGSTSATALTINGTTTINGTLTVNGGSGTVNGATANQCGGDGGYTGQWNTVNSTYLTVTDDGTTVALDLGGNGNAAMAFRVSGDEAAGYGGIGSGSTGNFTVSNGFTGTSGIGTFQGMSAQSVSVSGSATVSHGLSLTPDIVLASVAWTTSNATWCMTSTGSYGSSTYVIKNSAGSAYNVMAICITS